MLEIIEKSYIGILMIAFGIIVIIYMSKKPKAYPLVSVNFTGYMGGIAFILLGIINLLNKFNMW